MSSVTRSKPIAHATSRLSAAMMLTQKQILKRQAAPSRTYVCKSRSCVVVRATADPDASAQVSRRSLMAVGGLALASQGFTSNAAFAAEGAEYAVFNGLDTPPTSYGGYGGNVKEAYKYCFEYPTGWKTQVPNKTEKGTQGIDGRVVNPRVKGQSAFVITLARAGEDNVRFRLTDLDSTFAGFAGADYDLQDAMSIATDVKKSSRQMDGLDFYDYEIDSPEMTYLSTITVRMGKVYALFVKTPTRAWAADKAKLRHIVETFKLL